MDIHVLSGDADAKWTVVFHLNVPDAPNDVAVNYRTALVNSGLASVSQLADGDGTAGTISPTEKAALAAGTLYEATDEIAADTPGQTVGSLRAALRQRYAAAEAATVNRLKRVLKYFGHRESRS